MQNNEAFMNIPVLDISTAHPMPLIYQHIVALTCDTTSCNLLLMHLINIASLYTTKLYMAFRHRAKCVLQALHCHIKLRIKHFNHNQINKQLRKVKRVQGNDKITVDERGKKLVWGLSLNFCSRVDLPTTVLSHVYGCEETDVCTD